MNLDWIKLLAKLFASGNLQRAIKDVKAITDAVKVLTTAGTDFNVIFQQVDIIVTAAEDLISIFESDPTLKEQLIKLGQ